MSRSIDSRVVEMQFRNRQFMDTIKESIKGLDDLTEALNMDGAKTGLEDVKDAVSRFSLEGIAKSVEDISNRFSILGAVAFTVIQGITNKAMGAVSSLTGFVWDPLVEGGKKRALNIEQAKFQFEGLGMDVEASMASALAAVQGTAFGLDEAAVVAAQFGASGMQAGDEMTEALRGISGVAAMAGSSYADVGNIFTKVAGQGRLMGDDLNRLAVRGVNGAATLVDYFKEVEGQMGMTEEQVRKMVTRGEIDFETFAAAMNWAFGEHATKANETYTGSLSNVRAALSRIGASFFTPRLEALRKVFNAAAPAVDRFGEAIAPVVDLYAEMQERFSTRVVTFLDNLDFGWLNHILVRLVSSFRHLRDIADLVLGSLGDAFRQIFPVGDAWYLPLTRAVAAINRFITSLKFGEKQAEQFRRIFAGIFAVVDILLMPFRALFTLLKDLFGLISLPKSNGSLLEFVAGLGDMAVNFRENFKPAERMAAALETFRTRVKEAWTWVKALTSQIKAQAASYGIFDRLKEIGNNIVAAFKTAKNYIVDFFSSVKSTAEGVTTSAGEAAGRALTPLGTVLEWLKSGWDRFLAAISATLRFLTGIGGHIKSAVSGIRDFLGSAFEGQDASFIFDLLNTGIIVAVGLAIRRFINSLTDITSGASGFLENINEVLGGLTGALEAMQTRLKAQALLSIAMAIGVLAVSVIALSFVDGAKLTKAIVAITFMFAQLAGALTLLDSAMIGNSGFDMLLLSAALVVLAGAIVVLGWAVNNLGDMDWEELAKGLIGTVTLIGALSAAVQAMSGTSGSMISTGIGLLILGGAIKILASAAKDISELDWAEISKGLVGVAGLLTALGIFTRIAVVSKGSIASSAGLILVGLALKVLASALKDFSDYSWGDLGKGVATISVLLGVLAAFGKTVSGSKGLIAAGIGIAIVSASLKLLSSAVGDFKQHTGSELARALIGMGVALGIIAAAFRLMPATSILNAGAIVIAAAGIKLLVDALKDMGGMTWEELERGLTALAVSLIALAAAMVVMSGAIGGAVALTLVTVALSMFIPTLKTLGELDWQTILMGLGALAAVFAVIGVAGLLLTPVVPALIGLGIAIGLMGIGALAAGAGLLLFSAGLAALAVSGTAATAMILALIGGIAAMLPFIAEQVGLAILSFIETISAAAPEIVQAIINILEVLLRGLIELMPLVFELLGELLDGMIDLFIEYSPRMVEAGLDLWLSFLEGVESRIEDIVDVTSRIITKWLDGIAANIPDIAESGVSVLVAWIDAMADNNQKIIDAGGRFVTSLIAGITLEAINLTIRATTLVTAFLAAIGLMVKDIVDAGVDLVLDIIAGITLASWRLYRTGMDLIIEFLEKMADAVHDDMYKITQLGAEIAEGIVTGILSGLGEYAQRRVRSAAANVGAAAARGVAGVLGIRSPSRVMYKLAGHTVQGFTNGLNDGENNITKTSAAVGEAALESLRKSLSNTGKVVDKSMSSAPVIRPVVDLSEVRQGMSKIEGMAPKVAVDTDYKLAAAIAKETRSASLAQESALRETDDAPVQFIQNNHSPKALSSGEIYRNTKNLLSTARKDK